MRLTVRDTADVHGNFVAEEGCTFCICGCKYWESDKCIDCGRMVESVWLEQFASAARTMLFDNTLNWSLDRLRVFVGTARVLERDETHADPARMVPIGNGMCVLVVDN